MIIDFDESYNSVDDYASDESGSKKKYKGPVALSALVIVGALFLQNTLAANISLGTGAKLEFGQGVQVTTACSGSDVLTLTPNSSFVNSSGNGSYYLSSVTVSGIPTSCQGVDFNLSVYDSTTSTALPIFATSKTAVFNHRYFFVASNINFIGRPHGQFGFSFFGPGFIFQNWFSNMSYCKFNMSTELGDHTTKLSLF
jgi:hypothetical protein